MLLENNTAGQAKTHYHIIEMTYVAMHKRIMVLQLIFTTIYLQCPPFRMSHMDQKVSTSLLFLVNPPSMSRCAQKYITSPSVSCTVSSRTFSALMDNETYFQEKEADIDYKL